MPKLTDRMAELEVNKLRSKANKRDALNAEYGHVPFKGVDVISPVKDYLSNVMQGKYAIEGIQRLNNLGARMAQGDVQAGIELASEFGGIGAIKKVKALDDVFYHGTASDIKGGVLRASKSGEIGPGVYITKDFDQGIEYATGVWGANLDDMPGAKVLPLKVKGKMKTIDRKWWGDRRGAIMDDLKKKNKGLWEGRFKDEAEEKIVKEIQDQGFVGIYLKNPTGDRSFMYDQGVVFNPKDIILE